MLKKNNKSIIIAAIFFVLIASIFWFGNSSPLEKLLHPETGNHPAFVDYQNRGGLDYDSDFYGLDILRLTAEWRREKVGAWILRTAPQNSPNSIRKAMNKVCGSRDSDWAEEIDNQGTRFIGFFEDDSMRCRIVRDRGMNWELMLTNKKAYE